MKVKIQTNDHRDPKAVHERQIVASLTESIAGHLVNYDSIKTVVEILAAYLADVASKTMVDFVAAEPKTELVSYTPVKPVSHIQLQAVSPITEQQWWDLYEN